MDLRAYYGRIREVEKRLGESAGVVLVSRETPDGGRAGVLVEAPARVAAKMIVDGRAEEASAEEAAAFRQSNAKAARLAERQALANRVQVQIMPAPGGKE